METTSYKQENAHLKAIIEKQNIQLAEQNDHIAEQKTIATEFKAHIEELQEQVRLLKNFIYAVKTEKLRKANSHDPLYGQQMSLFDLFNESEHVESIEEVVVEENEQEEVTEIAAHTRKKKGRKPLTTELPRTEVLIDIAEEDKICPCGCQMTRIGEEVSEKLNIIPAKIEILRYVRPKYACTKGCKGADDITANVKCANMPPHIIPKGIATPALLSWIFVSKFLDALPFYRQVNIFKRIGADISLSTMSGWALKVAKACEPLVPLLYNRLRSGLCINLDETPLQVMREPGKENSTTSYMWVAKGGLPNKPVVLFNYSPNRNAEVAKGIVGEFKGYLQTDGYSGYNAIGAADGIIHVGCLVHIRRNFMNVLKAGGKNTNKSGIAEQVVDLIAKIYKLEKQFITLEYKAEKIFAQRLEKVKPILDKIKSILIQYKDKVPPKSLIGKAINYADGQWAHLENYLLDGNLKPDNNAVENAIRPFAVGRKNWLFAGAPSGANASALLYTLIETAKACGLEPMQYLCDLFTKIPLAKTNADFEALLPIKKLSSIVK